MKRQFGQLLGQAADTLFEVAAQQPEVAAAIGPVGTLLKMIAGDIDSHTADRLRQAEEIKSILRDARARMAPQLQSEIDAAIDLHLTEPADFELQAVEAHVVALKRVLIRTHIGLEQLSGPRESALLERLWTFLQADVDRTSRLVTILW